MKGLKHVLLFIICLWASVSFAQSILTFAYPGENVQFTAICEYEGHLLAAGTVGDNIIIAEYSTGLELLSSQVLSVDGGVTLTVPRSMLVDSDGFLVMVGYQWFGNETYSYSFVQKYDYSSGSLVWHRKYENQGSILQRIIQDETTGDYYVSGQNGHPSDQSAVLLMFDKDTGAETVISNVTHHPGSDTYWSVVFDGSYFYAAARYQYYGGGVDKMRTSITKIDPDGSIVYANSYITDTSATARLYAPDIALKEDHLYMLSHGDASGTSSSQELLITKTNLDGEQIWNNRYDYDAANDGIWHQITPVEDGLLVAGSEYNPSHSSGHGGGFFLLLINDDGDVQWSVGYPFNNDSYYYLGKTDIFEIIGDQVFAVGHSPSDGNGVIMSASLTSSGFISDDCSEVFDVNVISGDNIVQDTDLDDISYEGFEDFVPDYWDGELEFAEDLCPLFVYLSDVFCEGDSYILPDGSEVSEEGTYEVIIPSVGGLDSVIITELEMIESFYVEVEIGLCDGEVFELPSGIEVSDPGTYIIDSVSMDGCDSIIVFEVDVFDTYSFLFDTVLCEGESIILPDGSLVDEPGDYMVELLTIDGCDSVLQFTIDFNSTYLEFQEVTICEGDNYILPDGSEVNVTGVYLSELTTILGCDSIIETNLLVVDTLTTFLSTTLCEGNSYELPDGSYVSDEGVYTIELISEGGCDSLVTVELNVINELDPIEYSINSTDTIICFNTPQIDLWIEEGLGDVIWSTSETTDNITIDEEGQYFVVVSNDCFSYADTIQISSCLEVHFPNAFSPNDDNVNDFYQIINSGIGDNFLFEIFNRWGERIFSTTDPGFRWDGTYKNVEQEIGVYVFVAKFSFYDVPYQKTGTITLIR